MSRPLVIENAVFAARISPPNKMELIREVADLALSPENLSRDQVEATTRSIMGREELGSTGIGLGFAVPHTRYPYFTRVLVRLLPFSGEREFRKHGKNGQADVFETPAKCQGFQKLLSPN